MLARISLTITHNSSLSSITSSRSSRRHPVSVVIIAAVIIIIIIIIIIYSLEFFTSALADGLSLKFEGQQVSSSLQDSSQYSGRLSNIVVWMVSTRPQTSNSISPFSNPLVTVPNAPITIGIIVTCMFHSFFNSLARLRYLSFFAHSFSFIVVSRDSKVDNFPSSLFFVDYY